MAAIERLDPVGATDAELAAAYAVVLASWRQVADAGLTRGEADTISWIRTWPAGERRGYWVARRHGTVAGYAALCVPTVTGGGPVTARAVELVVAPEHRRHGLGRALLAAVRAEAVDLGASTLWAGVLEPAGAAFAEHFGARTGNRLRTAALRLPADLPAPAPPAGYRLRSWVGAAPEELIASYARATDAMLDSPHDDDLPDDEHWTPEYLRELEATVARRGQQNRVTVAVDGTGEVAGYTSMRVGPEHGTVARTEDTAVVAAHRGRGLARAVKLESLRRLVADRPDVTAVLTGNDVTNKPMLAVNSVLGFREVAIRTDVLLPLRQAPSDDR